MSSTGTDTPMCLMSPREHELLRQLARGKSVLELGAWCGMTTVVLAQVANRVWTVDHFEGDAFTGRCSTLGHYWASLRAAGVEESVITVVGEFGVVLRVLRLSWFDLVLVDGAHDYDSVRHDVSQAAALVTRTGAVAVHDYGRWDVERACSELLGFPDQVVDSLAIWRMPR